MGPWKVRTALTWLAVALLFPAAAGAQGARPYIGAGYVASAPNLFAGGAIYGVVPGLLGGLGLYVDAKFDVDRPTRHRGFEPEWTAERIDETRGDDHIRDEEVWYNVNVALLRPVTETLTLYVGAGYAERRLYGMYENLEPGSELGFGGIIWAEREGGRSTVVNLLGGAFIDISDSVSAQFGAERYPAGFTVGLSYRIPF